MTNDNSLHLSRLKSEVLTEVAKLQSSRNFRDRRKLFYIEGIRNLMQTAASEYEIVKILYSEKLLIVPPARQLVRKLRRGGTTTIKLTPEEFRSISHSQKASGIAAIVRQNWTKLDRIAPKSELCWIALEKVRSPGNLGTLIRTSEAIGGAGIILLGNSIDPYSSQVIRATMGTLFYQKIIRTDYNPLQRWLRHHSCRAIGASPDGKVDFHRFKYPPSTILFLGEERKGLTPNQMDLCHNLVRIPMTGKADSLNLGVAGSVLLYELYKHKANKL